MSNENIEKNAKQEWKHSSVTILSKLQCNYHVVTIAFVLQFTSLISHSILTVIHYWSVWTLLPCCRRTLLVSQDCLLLLLLPSPLPLLSCRIDTYIFHYLLPMLCVYMHFYGMYDIYDMSLCKIYWFYFGGTINVSVFFVNA